MGSRGLWAGSGYPSQLSHENKKAGEFIHLALSLIG